MYCLDLSIISKIDLKDLSTFLVSVTALIISALNYSRDTYKISFTAFAGNEMSHLGLNFKQNIFYLSILNFGRRPVSIKHIGFISDNIIMRLLNKIDQRQFPENGAILYNDNIKSILFEAKGNTRLLKEGEEVIVHFPMTNKVDLQFILDLFRKNNFMYAGTSDGRKFKLSSRQYDRIIIDLEDMIKINEKNKILPR